MTLARLRSLELVEQWAREQRTEEGRNNAGPFVEMLQRADSLRVPDVGYSWCQTTMNAAWRLATGGRIVRRHRQLDILGGLMLADGTASVGIFVDWCQRNGYVLPDHVKPQRGDHIALEFDSVRRTWGDHVGQISRVLSVGPVLALVTSEGNTGPTGSVSDPGSGRDGVYTKRRLVRRSSCWIARVPGEAVPSPEPTTRERPWPLPLPEWFWPWARWRLGREEYRGSGFPNLETRPRTPDPQVPAWAFRRLRKLQQELDT